MANSKSDVATRSKSIGSSSVTYDATQEISKQQRSLMKSNADLKSEIESLKKDIDASTQEIFKNKEEIKSEIESLKKDRLSTIESLGVFTFLFTFISIEFQVFQSYRNPIAIAGLSLLLLGSISFLLVVFDFLIKRTVDDAKFADIFKSVRILFIFIPIAMIGVGGFLFSTTEVESIEEQSEKIKKEIIAGKDIQEFMNKAKQNEKILNCLKIKGYFTNKCFE